MGYVSRMSRYQPPALPHVGPPPPTAPPSTIRIDGWTETARSTFIDAIADGRSAASAAKAAGMSVSGAYRLRRSPRGVEFRRDWLAAEGVAHDRVHQAMLARATRGREVDVWHNGEVVGTRFDVSDRMLIYLHRYLDPERHLPPLPPEPPAPPQPIRFDPAHIREGAALILENYSFAKTQGALDWQRSDEPDPELERDFPPVLGDEDTPPDDPDSRDLSAWERRDARRRWVAMDMARSLGSPVDLNLRPDPGQRL